MNKTSKTNVMIVSRPYSHLKAVLKALFPEKSHEIGKKRKYEASKTIQTPKTEPDENANIYKINFKKVS